MSEWEVLIERYADGRQVCNCGQAYYTGCGEGIDREGRYRYDLLACQYGCSGNQIEAKDYIARRVVDELKKIGDGK